MIAALDPGERLSFMSFRWLSLAFAFGILFTKTIAVSGFWPKFCPRCFSFFNKSYVFCFFCPLAAVLFEPKLIKFTLLSNFWTATG